MNSVYLSPPSVAVPASRNKLANPVSDQCGLDLVRSGHCTEEAEEAEEPKDIEETKEKEEREETKESEEPEEPKEINELHANLWSKIEKAIADCSVSNDPLFTLAKDVRGCEEAVGKQFSLSIHSQIIKRWQSINASNLDVDHDYLAEFLDKLFLVRFPTGKPLIDALKAAERLSPPKETAPLSKKVQLLACLCQELQRIAGPEPFYLAGRPCAALLGESPSTVASWLRVFRKIRIIKLDGQRGFQGHASRYRYIASMNPVA